MSEVIIAKKGWKKQVRLLWKKKKLLNYDFKGMMKNLFQIAKELGMENDKNLVAAYMFRNSVGKFRTYGEVAVLTEEGYKEFERYNKELQNEYGPNFHASPLDDLDDIFFQEFEWTTTESDLIKYLDIFIQQYDEVFIRLGGENPKTVEKSHNWDHYILTRPEVYVNFGDVCRDELGIQCQYGSYYLDGTANYPNLGVGLRIIGDKFNYHSLKIHRKDADTFIKRFEEEVE